jgi:hypothetical protein
MKTSIFKKSLSVIVLSLITFFGTAQISKQQAITFVMDSIVGNQSDSMNVYMDSVVQTQSYYVLSPYDSILSPYSNYWLFFIDEMPEYGWAHSCKYVFIDQNNGDHLIEPKRLPPLRYGALEPVSTPIVFTSVPPDFDIPYVPPVYSIPENKHLFAVMFTGGELGNDPNIIFWNALSHMYCGLIEHGFPKENIYVLSSNGTVSYQTNPSLDLNNDDVNDILQVPCSKSNLKLVFDTIKDNMDQGDMLYIFVTTHGDTIRVGESYFILYNHEKLLDHEFAAMLDSINCAQMIVNIFACYSGGFTNELLKLNNQAKKTILTCTDSIHPYLRGTDPKATMDTYSYLVCTALRGWHPDWENKAPWVPKYRIGNSPVFDSLFHKQEVNFDSLVNGGNGNGIQEIEETINYVKEYDDNQFEPWGSKINDCGFKEDLLSLYGLTGKVDSIQTVRGNFMIGGQLSIETGAELTLDSNANFFVFGPGITVQPGGTLTSYGDMFMPGTAQITVKPSSEPRFQGGGKLIIDGGDLNAINDDELWKGIEVHGLPDYDQTDRTIYGELIQGQVVIHNGGKIQNARIGIMASGFTHGGIGEYGHTGGFIYADSGYFINNKIAVQFDPYNHSNISRFQRCNFLTIGELMDESASQTYFVKLLGVNPVTFIGCTFQNTRGSNEVHFSNRGTGIFSENSGFYIDAYCLGQVYPCTHNRNSIFQGLTRGIYAMNSGSSRTIFLNDALLFDNYQALYLSGFTGISAVNILSNKFRNGRDTTWSYGMYLNECSGFHVEDNEFYEQGVTPMTIGLIVNNSGTSSNEIYRNTFHNLRFATLSQNNNRNYNPPLHLGGLCYRCNKFVKDDLTEPNWSDFTITYDGQNTNTTGIAKNQGTYLNSTFGPVGNMFHPDPATSHYDFYNEGNGIDYYYHSDNALQFRLRPDPNNIYGTVNTISIQATFNKSSCPSTLGGGGGEEDIDKMDYAIEQSDSIGNILSNLVDGGSTFSLNFEVITSTPPEALQTRNELLSESPYLSDTVMKSTVAKEDVLDNAMVRDVLVANPHSAKSDEIINMLENRTIPMPDYMMEEILAGEDTVSEKEVLEANKAHWDNEINKYFQRLIRNYKGDTAKPAVEDSLVWLLNYRNTLDSHYDLATWYHDKGKYNKSDSILDLIPLIFPITNIQQANHQAFIEIFDLTKEISTDTTGVFKVDSARTITLQNIVSSNTGTPGAWARNILITANKITYQEPIILPDTSLKSTKKDKYRGAKQSLTVSVLKVYPNPANDYIIVEYHLDDIPSQGMIIIHNATGRIIKSYSISRSRNQEIIPVSDLPTGLYLITLVIEGVREVSAKINIIN